MAIYHLCVFFGEGSLYIFPILQLYGLVFNVESWKLFTYSIDEYFVRHVVCKYFQSVACLFLLLKWCIIFNFDKIQYFFLVVCMSYLLKIRHLGDYNYLNLIYILRFTAKASSDSMPVGKRETPSRCCQVKCRLPGFPLGLHWHLGVEKSPCHCWVGLEVEAFH